MCPYTRCETTYINNIQSMLESVYTVVDYEDAKRKIYPLNSISVIYLNWIESHFGEDDKLFIQKAKNQGTRIVWVFHNKVPHDSKNIEKDVKNIKFLIDISDCICILSNGSRNILKEYDSALDERKIEYLPHQDFKGMFGHIKNPLLNAISKNGKLVFACYGLIRPYKNIDIIIKAFNEFNKNKKCKLIIAGKPADFDYVNELEKMAEDDDIFFIPEYIPASMMGSYIECADVLIQPYDLESAMNSSAMIAAFSYAKTVITANISMADDYSSDLIYKYTYNNDEDHVKQLISQMEKVYRDGKERVRKKGELLANLLEEHNSKDIVKDRLLRIVENKTKKTIYPDYNNTDFIEIIEEREIWMERFRLAEMYERMALAGKNIARMLLDSDIKEIAIYGYGKYGKRLRKELENADIKIRFIIDEKADSLKANIQIYKFEDELPPIGNLIVTAPGVNYYQIMEKMNQSTKCQVYILKEMY